MQIVDQIHGAFVHTRRVRHLAQRLAPLMPRDGTVLDVGCGDGAVAAAIAARRPDIRVTGLETLPRAPCPISVEPFDGEIIPRQDDSVDTVLIVDVLHHTHDPARLLSEALRVARRTVVIKDHNRNGLLAEPRDEAGLAECLTRLAADEALRLRLGACGRERSARHDWGRIAEEYLALMAR